MQGEIERAPLRIGLLPDTQGSGTEVSIHPMEAVLKKFQQSDVDLVIAVGDLTNQGSSLEFDQWTSVAEPFRNAGMEFIPLIGNHRSEEHTSELQSRGHLVCRLLLEKTN